MTPTTFAGASPGRRLSASYSFDYEDMDGVCSKDSPTQADFDRGAEIAQHFEYDEENDERNEGDEDDDGGRDSSYQVSFDSACLQLRLPSDDPSVSPSSTNYFRGVGAADGMSMTDEEYQRYCEEEEYQRSQEEARQDEEDYRRREEEEEYWRWQEKKARRAERRRREQEEEEKEYWRWQEGKKRRRQKEEAEGQALVRKTSATSGPFTDKITDVVARWCGGSSTEEEENVEVKAKVEPVAVTVHRILSQERRKRRRAARLVHSNRPMMLSWNFANSRKRSFRAGLKESPLRAQQLQFEIE